MNEDLKVIVISAFDNGCDSVLCMKYAPDDWGLLIVHKPGEWVEYIREDHTIHNLDTWIKLPAFADPTFLDVFDEAIKTLRALSGFRLKKEEQQAFCIFRKAKHDSGEDVFENIW